MKHKISITKHYNQIYSEIIGQKKMTFPFYQVVTDSQHVSAAPDQPIKASSTYRLVRSSLRLITNLKDIYAIN